MILSGLFFYALAYLVPAKTKLYAVAGTLCALTTPWTRLLVFPLNDRLLKKVEDTKAGGVLALGKGIEIGIGIGIDEEAILEEQGEGAGAEPSSKQLVDIWGTLNVGRGGALFLGGIVGWFAALT
jgi:hypothetical protein